MGGVRVAVSGRILNPRTSYEDTQITVTKYYEEGDTAHGFELGMPGEETMLLDPAKSLRYRNHSPTGFAWGYGGSGPSQLALGVLLECMEPGSALTWYQDFKMDYLANETWGEPFYFEFDPDKWVKEKEVERARGRSDKHEDRTDALD